MGRKMSESQTKKSFSELTESGKFPQFTSYPHEAPDRVTIHSGISAVQLYVLDTPFLYVHEGRHHKALNEFLSRFGQVAGYSMYMDDRRGKETPLETPDDSYKVVGMTKLASIDYAKRESKMADGSVTFGLGPNSKHLEEIASKTDWSLEIDENLETLFWFYWKLIQKSEEISKGE
jgi:hypothetical protein